MTVICVDAGTTMIKAVLYDESGKELAVTRRETSVLHPQPGWAEQDMMTVWDGVVATVRSAAAGSPQPVEAIAVTAQGDGCWLIDDHIQPTGPAILWNDARAAEVVTDWSDHDLLQPSFAINGAQAFAGLPHAILLWLQMHDPDRLSRSATSLTCGGWLHACLTGHAAVDESDAAAPFLDVRERVYSTDLLQMLDIGWMQKFLPTLRHDDSRIGNLSAGAADALGLPVGLPVVMAPYDIASTAIGAGVVSAGQACTILGTTLCTEVVLTRVADDDILAGLTIPMGVGRQYLRAFPTLAGTDVLSWAARILQLEGAAEVCQLAADAPAGADGLIFHPYLSPAGERVPFLDPQARGMLLGLSLRHSPALIARAVVEGLSFVIKDCLDASGGAPRELRLCGGGANSAVWSQLIADVTGIQIIRSTDSEAGARGAFITAMVALGTVADHRTAVDSYVKPRDVLIPGSDHSVYGPLTEDFRVLRKVSVQAWPKLAEIRDRLRKPR